MHAIIFKSNKNLFQNLEEYVTVEPNGGQFAQIVQVKTLWKSEDFHLCTLCRRICPAGVWFGAFLYGGFDQSQCLRFGGI